MAIPRVVRAGGVEGARSASGAVVVIDVLRAFTVTAFALAGGAREVIFATEVDEALRLAAGIPGAVVSAEEEGLPVAGVGISNSPSMIAATDLRGRTLVQRSSAGVQVLAAVPAAAGTLFAGSLVVASATVRALRAMSPAVVTLVASRPDHPEDHACSLYMEELLRDGHPDLDNLLQPLRASERYARLLRGEVDGFPPGDIELALAADRFAFSLPVDRRNGGLLRVLNSA